MSKSSGYSSRDDVHLDVFAGPDGRRWQGSGRPNMERGESPQRVRTDVELRQFGGPESRRWEGSRRPDQHSSFLERRESPQRVRTDVELSQFGGPESRRWQSPSRRPDQQSMSSERAESPHRMHLDPQHRQYPNRGSAQYQFDPRSSDVGRRPSSSRNSMQPRRSVHRRPIFTRQDVINDLPSRHMGDVLTTGESTSNIPLLLPSGHHQSEEHHAAQIVSEMEKDTVLMEDNPLSEQLRMVTLREMPESLTLKRTIKEKLVKSVSRKSKYSPLSFWKRFKYRISMSLTKFNVAMKNVLYTLELWYSSLKRIEGHFGSGVATYFRFLRWLFLMNTIVFLVSFGFIVIPQLLHRFYEPVSGDQTSTEDGLSVSNLVLQENNFSTLVTPLPVTTDKWNPQSRIPRVRSTPYASNADFTFGNIFTGEGFFTGTTLYYGYYTNESVSLVPGLKYHLPPAYFFTVLACYLFVFITLSVSMARSYRRTFIESAGDLKHVFAHKVFCSWDFGIATNEAAALKSKSLYNELTELLEEVKKEVEELSLRDKCCLLAARVLLNVFVGLVLAGIGALIWFLLDEELGSSEAATMVMPLLITVIMIIAPIFFSWLARYEEYNNPRTALFVTLTRTFLMEVVVIGVVVAFWLTFKKDSDCWETSLGQEVYRLVIIDFLFAIVGTSLAEFLRFWMYRGMWKKIGAPEFDIARNTLNLIYNQTLFFVGFYFSPLLAFIVVLKMFITFYVKKVGVLNNCQPSARPWRAAQTQTLFLVLSFVASLMVLILLGYVVTQVESSKCGPFRSYTYPYEMILGVFQVEESNGFFQFIKFLTKPGVTAAILLAMCVGVYYLRAKAHAHRGMVHILREMLVLEAKDKEFLLSSISKVTVGQWIYNLKTDRDSGADWSVNRQYGRRPDTYDSNSSSGASAAGEHASQPSVSYSDSMTDSDGFGLGDIGRNRSGYRPIHSRQRPGSAADSQASVLDNSRSEYSDMRTHPSDYSAYDRSRVGGLRDRSRY